MLDIQLLEDIRIKSGRIKKDKELALEQEELNRKEYFEKKVTKLKKKVLKDLLKRIKHAALNGEEELCFSLANYNIYKKEALRCLAEDIEVETGGKYKYFYTDNKGGYLRLKWGGFSELRNGEVISFGDLA